MNNKIIYKNNQKYLLQKKNKHIKQIHNYLENKDFSNFLPIIKSYNEVYDVYPYIEEIKISPEKKAKHLINLISKLHKKTITDKFINPDNIYEQIKEQINDTYKYYLDLQDNIESIQYMSPAEYLLIRNISTIYSLLNYSKNKLDNWYELIKKEKKERQAFLNGNINLNNYIYSAKEYLKDWNKSKKENVIYDFINFYKNEYLNLNMTNLFNYYQEKFKYNEIEKNLFFSIISIPEKVNLNNNNYINTLNVRKILLYAIKTHEFILKENKEEQDTYEKEFK